jgi:hypothetical protein
MRTISTALLSILALASTASAGAGDKAKDTTKDTTKTTTKTTTTTTTKSTDTATTTTAGADTSMQMPDPDATLVAAAKKMKGTWSCKGTMNDMQGAPMNVKGTWKWAPDLDKMWIRGDLKIAKLKGWKRGMTMTFFRSLQGTTWTQVMLDNMGGWGHETSTGPDATGKVSWDGESSGMGMNMKMHDFEEPGTKKGTFHVWGEFSMDGAKWQQMYDVTCSK